MSKTAKLLSGQEKLSHYELLKTAGHMAAERAQYILKEAAEMDEVIEKLASASDEELEEQYGKYVKMGHDMAIGMFAAQIKVAMEMEEAEAAEAEASAGEIQEILDTVAAQAAEEIASQVPPEALEDPQVQEEIAAAAEEAAIQVIEEAIAASEGAGEGAEEYPAE
jgi:hypothetical protein